MKNKISHITRMSLFLGVTAIAALCLAPPVRAGGGPFYPTVTNVTQLVADINYANTNGGTFTINLQPNTTFDLVTGYGNDGFGADLLPIIGTPKAVNLTILGNGDTIQRDPTDPTTYNERLLEVTEGSSLTLDQMTLQYGYANIDNYANIPDAFNGGAICNFGTLVISNCTLYGNWAFAYLDEYGVFTIGGKGGAIFNDGGTVIISDSFLSTNNAVGDEYAYGGGGIYNYSGTVTISHSIISGNGTYGGGGGIFNDSGTVTVENSSSISGNYAADFGPDVYNLGLLYLDGTSTIVLLDGNSAIGLSPALSIHSWSSTAHQLVLSWNTNYAGFTLQSSTGPGSTNWTDCASPAVSGASFVVTNAMSAGAQFFRLKR
jgi:hypothetical protein